jgi:maltose/moltooligosaccharide transporter
MEMHTHSLKPRLSFWQLWNMSFGFFGIQFGFALQNANTSRIFSTLGASPTTWRCSGSPRPSRACWCSR